MNLRPSMFQGLLLLPLSLVVANAATIITYTDPFVTLNANAVYAIQVNNGGNQHSAQYLSGDPTPLTHTAFTALIEDAKILEDATLDLNLSSTGPTGSRVASYFTGLGVNATYNPTFTVNRSPQYTVTVSSSAGTNSYIAAGSVVDLNVLSLLNFSSLLDQSATSRSILVSWQDTVDFVLPAAMQKGANSLPGSNPFREYRWNVAATLTGGADLTLTTSDSIPASVPEPASMLLLGSSLVVMGASSRCLANRSRGTKK